MRTALVVDFNPKNRFDMNHQFDFYVLDRFNNKIVNIETNCHYQLDSEIGLKQFYQSIKQQYDQIFSLLVSYSYSDINDHLIGMEYNQERSYNDAKVYTYLLNYCMRNKVGILDQVITMLNHHYSIKDMIIRIHNNRQKEPFSIYDILNRHISCIN